MTRYTHVTVKRPGWKIRLCLTLVVLAIAGLSERGYRAIQGPLESKIAIKQLNGSEVDYAIGQAIAAANVPEYIQGIALGCLVVVWATFALKLKRYYNANVFLIGGPASDPKQ